MDLNFYIFKGNYSYLIKKNLLKLSSDFIEIEDEEESLLKANFIWKPTNFNQRIITMLNRRNDNCNNLIINHLPLNNLICFKTGLYRTLKYYYSKSKQFIYKNFKVNQVIPISFLLTSGNENEEFFNFIKLYTEILKKGNKINKYMNPEHFNENLWWIKPANMNQGKGIKIMNKLSNILEFIKLQKLNSFWLVQKYIEKPLLYKSRKFDIRVWVLVWGNFDIYIFKNSYIRTSSYKYEVNIDNSYIHLTNNIVQMKSDKYGEYEEANILSIEEFEKYIKENIKLSYNFKDETFKDIINIVIDVINGYKFSNKLKINKNYFELFGFDFMIDEFFQTWLIECNSNPNLATNCKILDKEVNNMLFCLIKIVLENYSYNKILEKNTKKNLNNLNLKQDHFYLIYRERYINNKKIFISKRTQIQNLYNNFSINHFNSNNIKNLNLSVEEDKNIKNKKNKLMPIKEINDKLETNKIRSFPYIIVNEWSKNNINCDNKLSEILKNIINIMINWELHDLKQINYCINGIKVLINSGYDFLLCNSQIIKSLKNLSLGETVLIYLQTEIVKILRILLYNNHIRKLLINSNKFLYLIHIFVNILGNSINKSNKQKYPKEIENLSLEVLIEIINRTNNKVYVPGEIKENNKINSIFYNYGINLIIYILYLNGEKHEKSTIQKKIFSNYKKKNYENDLLFLNNYNEIINNNSSDLYLIEDLKKLFLDNFDKNLIKEMIIKRLKKQEVYYLKNKLIKIKISKNIKLKNYSYKNKQYRTVMNKNNIKKNKNTLPNIKFK